jgi:predicted transcriptional regulator
MILLRKTLRMVVRTGRGSAGGERAGGRVRRVPVNMSLPVELVRELDQVAGPRNRSAFAEESLRRALRRERWRITAERFAGSLKAEDYPHWRTPDDVVAWVRAMRAEETDPGGGVE